MNAAEADFRRAIDAAPEDEGLRAIFSDWLTEQGRDAEANQQRGWLKAFHFIKRFTREHDDGWAYDDDTEKRVGDMPVYEYEKVLGEIEWWADCVTGKETRYGLAGSISFSTDYAADTLEDPDIRRQFWECFAVLTGVVAPKELRNQERYRCAC